jgi:quercetin dioxygenase-like cupin family protein
MGKHAIEQHPVHLGLGASAGTEPRFTGDPAWYQAYTDRHADDGVEGRLISQFTFRTSWESWEMHPHGSEVVICTAGRMTLHQEHADGRRDSVVLEAGEYAINPPGTWHTADVDGEATALFVTAGIGTEHRPRD